MNQNNKPFLRQKLVASIITHTVLHPLTNLTLKASPSGINNAWHIVSLSFGTAANKTFSKNTDILGYGNVLKRFLDGSITNLQIPISLENLSPFARDVLMAAQRIAWGRTISYTELAGMAGHPRAVRAAASVMRRNPFPLIIPCHRVIGKNGEIGGFMGVKAGDAIVLKKKLLENEKQGCTSLHRS